MDETLRSGYERIRDGEAGFYRQPRGLIAVWGKEAVQFLDGMITNDMKTLEDGWQMLAAFPNAQGRLLAVVRVLRQGDRFLLETEEATREKLFQNLFRFTFAGDFFVEDLSADNVCFELFGSHAEGAAAGGGLTISDRVSSRVFVPLAAADGVIHRLTDSGAVEISPELYELLRIENGVPLYDVDMDEATIVPELGLDGLISYNKGCYIGQEIIARIYFRGHVAKRLTGIVSEPGAAASGFLPDTELTADDGKNAGRVTSAAYSPRLGKHIALAYVRYDFLAAGTMLNAGRSAAIVIDLPFIS